MIRRLVALLVVFVLVSPAAAAPHKVLVLPLDGNATPETRKKLSASFQKMARILEGVVEAGNTSLNDTAAAIGCDPTKPTCVESVRATLGVDELVYGTADEQNGTDTIVVVAKRYKKGKKPKEAQVTVASSDPAGKVETELLPVFSGEPLPEDKDPVVDPNANKVPDPTKDATGNPIVDPTKPPEGGTVSGSNRERNIAIGITAGGGLLVLLGLALWAQKSSLQDDIDNHSTDDVGDFEDLKELEDKASSRGWAGNVFVLVGLAVAGYGGYRLLTYSRNKRVTVTPTPVEGGATVTLTIVGDGW